jgi:hypothetical protein
MIYIKQVIVWQEVKLPSQIQTKLNFILILITTEIRILFIITLVTYPNSARSSTSNPLDRPLYRQENNDSLATAFRVVDFNIAYHDSIGNILNYSLLNTQAGRNFIKTMSVILTIESSEHIEGKYQNSQWKKKITPKNLR